MSPRAGNTSPAPWLLFPQVWGWPQVQLEEVLLLFAPTSYYSNCFLVTCLALFLFCLLREINLISLISTGTAGSEGETQRRLNSFWRKYSNRDWRRGGGGIHRKFLGGWLLLGRPLSPLWHSLKQGARDAGLGSPNLSPLQ